jgi:hypothetical protein
LSGSFASAAAVPTDPGLSLSAMPYYYSGSAGVSHVFQRGDILASDLRSQSSIMSLQPGYTFDTTIAGGWLYMGLGLGFGHNDTEANISIASLGSRGVSDGITGRTDVAPFASLAWNSNSHNWMLYLTGNVPVGTYDSAALANIGLGHGAIDGGGAYTYFNAQNGHEFSATVGVTHNYENTDVGYRSGTDSHLDWAASQVLSPAWEIGIAGYLYYQLTDDQYPTEGITGEIREKALGGFKSRIAGVGPEAMYNFKLWGHAANLNLRGYWEFAAKDRIEGNGVFATLSLPL